MTCAACREQCEENDAEPECERFDSETCSVMQIHLDERNEQAWQLYHQHRSKVSRLLEELSPPIELTESERDELRIKIAVIDGTLAELEDEDRKRKAKEIDMKSRIRGGGRF